MSLIEPRAPSTEESATNVANQLSLIAQRYPDAVAVATPGDGDVAGKNSYTTCTFAELHRDAKSLARGLVDLGVTPGMRLVLLVRPGIEFVKLVFALLRTGATTVLIDPGMGRKHLVNCLAATKPEGFVAVSPAQAVRTLLRNRFPKARLNVTVGWRWFWRGKTYEQVLRMGQQSQTELPATSSDDPAAIIFTSGSTGPPKGVLYTHRMFATQANEIRRQYDLQPCGADLSCFPLFGLFNSVMGVTTVFPDMDFARPASADPQKILAAAHDWQVTQAFASPAVWKKLSQHCADQGEQIPTLRKVFSCGAPVPASVIRKTLDCVSAGAEMHTPYGATESLPVATIEAEEVLKDTAAQTDLGEGICVGRKFDTIEWKIIEITDEPISSLSEIVEVPPGEVGELIVRGPQVSPEYIIGNEHNAKAKISDGDNIWHRMGDVGYFDNEQRFWYCGRKTHRVKHQNGSLFTTKIEQVVNTLPNVRRSALVGVLRDSIGIYQDPVLVVEWEDKRFDKSEEVWDYWCSICPQIEHLWYGEFSITDFPIILFHPALPVDVRHNSKINREALALWASKQLNTPPNP